MTGDPHRILVDGVRRWGSLGKFLVTAERLEEAEEVAREVLRVRKAVLPPGHWQIALTETLLGEVLAGRGRYPEE